MSEAHHYEKKTLNNPPQNIEIKIKRREKPDSAQY